MTMPPLCPFSSTFLRIWRLVLAFLLGFMLTVAVPATPGFSQAAAPVGADVGLNAIERGRAAYQQERWEDAIAIWQMALKTQGDNLATDLAQATLWTYLGMAYQKMDRWEEAQTAVDTALQRLEAITPSNQRSHLLAQALNVQGQLKLAEGEVEQAILTWQRVTQIYQDLNYDPGVTGSRINQARALEINGYYRRACQVLLAAIDLDDQSCDVNQPPDAEQVLQHILSQPDVSLQLLTLRSLGNIFRLKGFLPQAQSLLHTSLELAQSLADPQTIGLSLLNLAHVEAAQYQRMAFLADRSNQETDRQAALNLARQALEHYSAIDARLSEHQDEADRLEASNRLLRMQAAIQRFNFLIQLNHWLAAQAETPEQQEFQRQLQAQDQEMAKWLSNPLPPSREVLYSQIDLARGLMQRWQDRRAQSAVTAFATTSPDLIRQLLEQIQQQADGLDDPQAQSYAWGTLGQFYELLALQEQTPAAWAQAQTATQQALGLAQSVQAWSIAYQWQWQLGRIYQAQGQTEAAIAHYQAAAATLSTVRQDLLAVESQVQLSFRDDVEPVYRELVSLLLASPNGTPPSQANLQLGIEEIDALQLTELENFLSCNLTPTIALGQPQTDPKAAILYPILLPDQLVVLARLPQSDMIQFHAVAIARDEATHQLEQLRQQVEQRYLSDAFLAQSQQVYDWLIRPFRAALEEQQVQTLVFVSDGVIRNLPMAALYDGERFLVEAYAIALSPGLQIPASTPLPNLQLDVLAFGLSEIRPDFPPHANFAPLVNVERELNQIATEVSSHDVLNQSFTSEALQTWIGRSDAPIVHIATHGQFSSDPNDTFLLAWDRRIILKDFSNILQTRENPNTKAIELLVLSACKTADGDDRATLGLAGITIQSGARSTIGSLWYVDDQSTSELVGRLYQELAKSDAGMTRAEALRRAQVNLLHSPGYRAPVFWAPYVLVGNWQ
ncbi:MAG: CHAT domain-containing protein [Elainella sp. C42_A2020_010]|nr:CHAT domain-containing protein [Elainella sp. C42_A2020_010]